jgi:ribosome biogenesis GTPase / thiamine phosphate phosphatase
MHSEFQGRVIRAQSRRFTVLTDGGPVTALVPKRMRFEDPDWVDPVGVGDEVLVSTQRGDTVIQRVLPRRNCLARRALGGTKRQLLAANVDRAVIVLAAAEPEWKPATLDRYLVLASVSNIPAMVWINKSDLVPRIPDAELLDWYKGIDIPVRRGSATSGEGVQELSSQLSGQTAVFIGPSGTGKSSLLNRLVPSADARVGDVSASSGKGVHTTTWVEMQDLPGGGHVIDGPGLRTLDLSDVSIGRLARHFPEMHALADDCRFPDCAHISEPDCAVKSALSSGGLAPHRYESYRRIYESLSRGNG